MSAKNGLAVSFRSRGRIIGLCLVVLFALSAVFSSAASAAKTPIKENYLALGDSISFGYSQALFNANFPAEPVSAFEAGVVNKYWKKHKPAENGIGLINNACPGETTNSLIGNGPLGAAVDPENGQSPCAYHKAGFPLHHNYGAGQSQLENALEVVATDAFLGTPVTNISLNIGANDQLHTIKVCEEQAAAEVKANVKARIEKEIGEKLAKGEITPEEIPATAQKLGEEEAANPANHAEGVKLVSQCIALAAPALGKAIGTNIGTIMFVLRNGSLFGGVNYEGPIEFLGAYDPYGNLLAFPTKNEVLKGINDELLGGSNALVSIFNSGFKNEAVQPFGGCFADSHLKFNPQNRTEPEKLQKWTEMLTGDIHPSPSGYTVLASVLFKDCG
jgi:lysophospholipase L1-like esterase